MGAASAFEPERRGPGVLQGTVRGPYKQQKISAPSRRLEALRNGTAPSDIMYHNMMYWHKKAQQATAELEAHVVDPERPETVKKITTLLNTMLMCRNRSQSCAVDLAPYWQPKLAQVTVRPGEAEGQETEPEALPVTPVEASQVYQRLIAGPKG